MFGCNSNSRGVLRGAFLTVLAALSALAFAQEPSLEARLYLNAARQALDANPDLPYSPTTLLVRFAPSATEAQRTQARAIAGGPNIYRYDLVPGLELIGTRANPLMVAAALSAMPGVLYAEPDYTRRADVIPNDPSFGSLYGLHNTGQSGGTVDADIDAPEAWDFFTGDPNFVVADIDTGVQRTHPDLSANTWTNPGEIAGNGIDDDGNGRIDDLYGWDFYNNDNDPMDDNGHGTHTAGTFGAVGNNSLGVTGVNWRLKIMALKFLGAGGSGSTSGAIGCVNYAAQKGVKVSNNSWGGGGYSQALSDAINAAKAVGHLFCAAAGNSNVNTDSSPHYPSSYNLDNIISVASTDRYDNRSSFSNYGANSVDLGAPGSSIYSTYITNTYGTLSGTSMATPHVTGVVALVYGYNPGWTYGQVRDAIFQTVRPISALSGITVTGGVVNAHDALAFGAPVNDPPVVNITSPANGSSFLQGTSVNFAGSANDPEDGNISGSLVWTSSLDGAIGSGASFSTSSLTLGTHTITASATDSGGLTGQASITVTIQSAASPPAAPSNLSVTKLSAGVAQIAYSDNSNNETGFRVERQKRVGNTWSNTTTWTVGANVTGYTDSPGTGRFRYRVQAFNANGNSAWTGYVSVKL